MSRTNPGRDERPSPDPSTFRENSAALAAVPALLLHWYDHAARTLPWRSDPTPYRVWISEIMLQQTRVEAARGYFERFVAALPDVASLAAIDDDALLKLWEGLGYYSRARSLKRAALLVLERHAGVLPGNFDALLELPGIGEYSAGAIGSIGFGLRVPAVDGNVLRVVSRLLASDADVTLPSVRRELTALVTDILPQERVGDFNQALMELGATVCLPNGAPRCPLCPLSERCEGHRRGIAGALPIKAAKKPRRVQQISVFFITKEKNLYLRKRPNSGLLAGLWELPNTEGALSPEQAALALASFGVAGARPSPAGVGKHVFTHIEWHMTLFACELPPGASPGADWVEVTPDERKNGYPLPSAFLSLLKNL